jgi:hypothetical protein
MSDKLIFNLDSTALRASSCAHKFYNTVVLGIKDKGMFNDTMFGVAFHKFLARMQESEGNFSEAVKAARQIFSNPSIKIREKKAHMDEKFLIKVCLDYWEYQSKDSSYSLLMNPIAKCWKCEGKGMIKIPDSPDNTSNYKTCEECHGEGTRLQPMVEQTFSIRVYEEDSFQINIEGTLDEIGKITNGCYVVDDYKTTSSWQVEKYLRPFRLSPQLKLYVWAIKTLAKQNPDGLLGPLIKLPVGARIKGIFIKSQKETEFKNSEVFQFKEQEMQEFEALLQTKILQLAGLIKKTILPIRNGAIEGTCMHPYGCLYFPLCAAQDDVVRQHMIKNFYEVKPYKPLHFHDVE